MQPAGHSFFNVWCRNSSDLTQISGLAILQQPLRDIIAVSDALLDRVAGRHPIAGTIEKEPCQREGRRAEPEFPGNCILSEFDLDCLENRLVQDSRVIARVNLAAMRD